MTYLMNYKINFLVFLNLLKRDVKNTFSNFKHTIIDSFILAFFISLLYGLFFPALGMSTTLSVPLFLGSIVNLLTSVSYSKCVSIKSDIEFKRVIDYHLTLPISKYWLLFEYIIAFTIDLIISSLPGLLLGLAALNYLSDFKINFMMLILIFIVSSLFYSIMFLIIAFGLSWNWFINNTWERLLAPMSHFGAIFFVWNRLNNVSPILAKIALFSPITYITEGLRSTLVTHEIYISTIYCLTVLLCGSFLLIVPLVYVFNKKFDPV